MAGIVVNKAQWDALLQEEYVHDGIVSAVNKATPFKSKLKRKSMTAGRRRIYPVQVGMSQGNGARGEGDDMPDYGAEEFVDAIVQAKYNYGTFKVTGPSMEFSTRSAWVEFGDRQLTGTKEGLTQDIGRQCWGDGSGKLGKVNNGGTIAAGTLVIPVNSAFGVAWGCLSTKTTILFKKNQSIVFEAEDNNGQGYRVSAVGATSITLASPLINPVPDATAIYKKKTKSKEISGFLQFVATASFMSSVLGLGTVYNGIDRALYDSWEGNVVNANGLPISLPLVRLLKDTVYKRAEDEESNLCINSTEVCAAYEALLTPEQRQVPPLKLQGGYTALSHDGLAITKDSKAPIGSFQIMNTAFIAWAQTRDPHWDDDGSGIMHRVEGQDARSATLKWYAELDVDEPRRQGILYNIGGLQ